MTKRVVLTTLAVLVSVPALLAPASAAVAGSIEATLSQVARAQRYTVVLAGGQEPNAIRIWRSADGRALTIDSAVPLEVGGTVCRNPDGEPTRLLCRATQIAGFEVKSGAGDDRVVVARNVSLPVTLRGGGGDDLLVGGSADDVLLGGPGDDRLGGWRGDDVLLGGPGEDRALGGPGDDTLRGGPGIDLLWGGPGSDDLRQFRGLRGHVRG